MTSATLGRLIVRLVGDASGYNRMLKDAEKRTIATSRTIGKAQVEVQDNTQAKLEKATRDYNRRVADLERKHLTTMNSLNSEFNARKKENARKHEAANLASLQKERALSSNYTKKLNDIQLKQQADFKAIGDKARKYGQTRLQDRTRIEKDFLKKMKENQDKHDNYDLKRRIDHADLLAKLDTEYRADRQAKVNKHIAKNQKLLKDSQAKETRLTNEHNQNQQRLRDRFEDKWKNKRSRFVQRIKDARADHESVYKPMRKRQLAEQTRMQNQLAKMKALSDQRKALKDQIAKTPARHTKIRAALQAQLDALPKVDIAKRKEYNQRLKEVNKQIAEREKHEQKFEERVRRSKRNFRKRRDTAYSDFDTDEKQRETDFHKSRSKRDRDLVDRINKRNQVFRDKLDREKDAYDKKVNRLNDRNEKRRLASEARLRENQRKNKEKFEKDHERIEKRFQAKKARLKEQWEKSKSGTKEQQDKAQKEYEDAFRANRARTKARQDAFNKKMQSDEEAHKRKLGNRNRIHSDRLSRAKDDYYGNIADINAGKGTMGRGGGGGGGVVTGIGPGGVGRGRRADRDGISANRMALLHAEQDMEDRVHRAKNMARLGATIVGVVSLKAYADFNQSMTRAASITENTTETTTKKLSDNALRLSTVSVQGPRELADAYYALAQADKTAAQQINFLPTISKFATIAHIEMGAAAKDLVGIQKAMLMTGATVEDDAKQLQRIADVVAKTAQMSLTDVAPITAALTNRAAAAFRFIGKDIEEASAVIAVLGDQLKEGKIAGSDIDRAVRLLSKTSIKNEQVHKQLNFSVFENGKIRNMADIAKNLEDISQGMDPEEKIKLINTLGFDVRSQQVIFSLIGMSDEIRRYEANLRKATGFMNEVAEKQMASFTNQLKMMWNQLTVVAIQIGEILAPAVTYVGKGLTALTAKWISLSDETKKYIVIIASVLTAAGPLLTGAIFLWKWVGPLKGVTRLFKLLAFAVRAVLTPMGLLSAIFLGIAGLWVRDLGGIENAFNRIGDTLSEFWNNNKVVWEDAKSFVRAFVREAGANLDSLWKWTTDKLTKLGGWFGQVFKKMGLDSLSLKETLRNTFRFMEFSLTHAAQVSSFVWTAMKLGAVESLLGIIDAWNWLKNGIAQVFDWITKNWMLVLKSIALITLSGLLFLLNNIFYVVLVIGFADVVRKMVTTWKKGLVLMALKSALLVAAVTAVSAAVGAGLVAAVVEGMRTGDMKKALEAGLETAKEVIDRVFNAVGELQDEVNNLVGPNLRKMEQDLKNELKDKGFDLLFNFNQFKARQDAERAMMDFIKGPLQVVLGLGGSEAVVEQWKDTGDIAGRGFVDKFKGQMKNLDAVLFDSAEARSRIDAFKELLTGHLDPMLNARKNKRQQAGNNQRGGGRGDAIFWQNGQMMPADRERAFEAVADQIRQRVDNEGMQRNIFEANRAVRARALDEERMRISQEQIARERRVAEMAAAQRARVEEENRNAPGAFEGLANRGQALAANQQRIQQFQANIQAQRQAEAKRKAIQLAERNLRLEREAAWAWDRRKQLGIIQGPRPLEPLRDRLEEAQNALRPAQIEQAAQERRWGRQAVLGEAIPQGGQTPEREKWVEDVAVRVGTVNANMNRMMQMMGGFQLSREQRRGISFNLLEQDLERRQREERERILLPTTRETERSPQLGEVVKLLKDIRDKEVGDTIELEAAGFST